MTLYEVSESGLTSHAPATFAELDIWERRDLQRMLLQNPEALGDGLFVIAEEFGNWSDAKRRIDILALDKDGHIVVVELKRTDDGGHMELQALRYAAMVAPMGFEELVEAHGRFLAANSALDVEPEEARTRILEFLGVDDSEEAAISSEVRIILGSADFNREITTAVLWLNQFDGMDIRCVRLVPYQVDGKVLLDVRQIIPLPEAGDYQVRIGRKDRARERAASGDGRDFTKYCITFDGAAGPALNKRQAVKELILGLVERGVDPEAIVANLKPRQFKWVPGQVDDPDDVYEALRLVRPEADRRRWFVDAPIFDTRRDRTLILSKMWGTNTERTLASLTTAFPKAGIGYRPATASGAQAELTAEGIKSGSVTS